MIDVVEVKKSIIKFIEENGPSLPIHISRHTELEPMWASAILAELIQEKRVIASAMKVGASSLYFLSGQEKDLERFANEHLKGVSKDALLLLKSRGFLEDSKQSPQFRVALRGLKDFAFPFKFNEVLMWRYAFADKEEIRNKLEPKEIVKENVIAKEIKVEAKVEDTKEIVEEQKELPIKKDVKFVSPVKDDSDFVDRVKGVLERRNIKLLEETDVKKREFWGVGRMDSILGEIEVLIVGKDKKNIVDKDLEKIFEVISERKRICLLITTGEVAKKTKEVYRKYKNVIVVERV